jgi:integrase
MALGELSVGTESGSRCQELADPPVERRVRSAAALLRIETLFADYRKKFAEQPVLTTHMFRKRAFTMAWEAGIDARRASIAYGCNVDTLMGHYVALDEQQVTDEVFARMNPKDK